MAPMCIRRLMLRMEEEHDHLGPPMEDTEPRDKEASTGLELTLLLEDPTVGTEDNLREDIMDTMLHRVMCPLE